MFMRSPLLAVAALGVVLAAPPTTRAAYTVYTSEAAFLAAAGPTTLESFEGVAGSNPAVTSATPVTTAPFTVSPVPGLITVTDDTANTFGSVPTEGTKFLYSYRPGQVPGTLQFDFAAPVTGFGFTLIDVGEADGTVVIQTDAGDVTTPVTVFTYPPLLGNGNLQFVGLTQDVAFTRLSLTVTVNDEAFAVDEAYVAFAPAAVPEPAGLVLSGVGVAGLIGAARRRRGRPA